MPENVFEDIGELVSEPAQIPVVETQPNDISDIQYTHEDWPNLVMQGLRPDEFVELNGCKYPTVHGLRRICEKYLGTILESCSNVVQSPTLSNRSNKKVDKRELYVLEPAVVTHYLRLRLHHWHPNCDSDRVYQDCADAYADNNPELDFYVHPTAIAATRAEARALRKALRLKMISAEEITRKNKEVLKEIYKDKEEPTVIEENQINVIKGLADRNEICLVKYLKFKGIDKLEAVAYNDAKKLVKELSDYQKKWDKRPKEILKEMIQTPLN